MFDVDELIRRRTLLGVVLSAPTVIGLAACGLRPEKRLNAAPFVQFVVRGAASAFGTTSGVVATKKLTEAARAARDRLRAEAGQDLNAVWAADLDGKGRDIIVGGYWGDSDHLCARVLRTSGGHVLPAVVQLGLNLHADHIRSVRQKTNWSGWRSMADGAIREWLRDELTLSAFNLRPANSDRASDNTDDILTTRSTYLCLLRGNRDPNDNPNIQIEWQPTTLDAEHSSVVINRGRAFAGHDQWVEEYRQTVGLRFPVLWMKDGPTPSIR